MRSLFGKSTRGPGGDRQHVGDERFVALIHDRARRLGLLERAARRRFEIDDRARAVRQRAAARGTEIGHVGTPLDRRRRPAQVDAAADEARWPIPGAGRGSPGTAMTRTRRDAMTRTRRPPRTLRPRWRQAPQHDGDRHDGRGTPLSTGVASASSPTSGVLCTVSPRPHHHQNQNTSCAAPRCSRCTRPPSRALS